MTYGFTIDQEFAIINELSLVQVSTLAAFMTLPIWSKTVAIDGFVWYQYSEEKMAEDFPLLFGVAKRCYKNITELADMGFVELTKLGRIKYVRFTSRCADWNKKKEQIWSNSPKTDQKQSENGPENGPKTDRVIIDYNIINSNIENKPADGGLFEGQADFKPVVVTAPRGTSEQSACLFANSRFANYELFKAQFTSQEFQGVDIAYYYGAVSDWSASNGAKKKDWIATVRNFIRNDKENKKVHMLQVGLSPDEIDYLKEMADLDNPPVWEQ